MKSVIKIIIKEIMPNFVIRIWDYIKIRKINAQNFEEDVSDFSKRFNFILQEKSIIIGNGPSLKYTLTNHLDFFNNKAIFCVNSFVSSDYFEIVKPEFYILADPIFWHPECSPKIKESISNVYNLLLKKVSWDLFLFLPTTARNWNSFLDINKENKNIKIVYFNNRNLDSNIKNKFILYKKNIAMPQSQTVLVAAVFLSLNLGFKTNYIVGGDLSLHEDIFVDKQNVVCLYDKHFYDDKEKHSVPFWKVENENDIFKMDELFLAFSAMFKGFLVLEDYSKYLGVKIYNASHRSYIDAFERCQIPIKN